MVAALTFQPPAAGSITGVMRLRQADKLMLVELIAMIDTPRGVELRFRHFTGALEALETTFKQTMLLKSHEATKDTFENLAEFDKALMSTQPRVSSWIVKTPELCARCHTDAAKMGKYGLSTNVVQSYLADFHGVTARTSRARTSDAISDTKVTALCIDCHGVHDITKADAENSPVLRANLVKTCRKCHPSASENFPDAWLSHYEPSWDRAPLVYAVKLFYMIFIPFIVGGLILQVLLHLWRVVVNR